MRKDTHFNNFDEVIHLLGLIEKECENHESLDGKIVLVPFNIGGLYHIAKVRNTIYLSHYEEFYLKKTIRSIPLSDFPEKKELDFIFVLAYMDLFAWNPEDDRSYEKASEALKDKEMKEAFIKIINDFVKIPLEDRHEEIQDEDGLKTPRIPEGIAKKYRIDPSWKECSFCKSFPHDTWGYWKGGVYEAGNLPSTKEKLEIVGDPYFDDMMSYRHWCVKRCVECKSHYLWEFDYEYLVNGTEDDVYLTRLSKVEEERWLKEVFKVINAAQDKFDESLTPRLEVLECSDDIDKIKKAVDYIQYPQLKGLNVSRSIHSLVKALKKHGPDDDLPWVTIKYMIKRFAEENKKNKELVEKFSEGLDFSLD
ncbi:MAG: hypothetical protein ACFFCS_16190 [Candidatus Hodarchaeota archaeon]